LWICSQISFLICVAFGNTEVCDVDVLHKFVESLASLGGCDAAHVVVKKVAHDCPVCPTIPAPSPEYSASGTASLIEQLADCNQKASTPRAEPVKSSTQKWTNGAVAMISLVSVLLGALISTKCSSAHQYESFQPDHSPAAPVPMQPYQTQTYQSGSAPAANNYL
jgi:hypothetical protein